MGEYKPNSNKLKKKQATEEKSLTSVVSGKTKTKKKSEVTKFANVFISEDISNVKSYVVMDVLIPAIKKAISDIVTNGVDMILYGETGHTKKHSTASKISYTKYYKGSEDWREPRLDRVRNGFDYDDIIFESRGDAEAVLTAMEDVVDQFGVASVGDLYDLAEISTTNYAVNKYGWTDLRSAQVIRTRDGYLLKLPRAVPLN